MILFPEDITLESAVGGKANALFELQDLGLAIPPWFVITPAAFFESVKANEAHSWKNVSTFEQLQSLLENLEPTAQLKKSINAALKALPGNPINVAVRSSAANEDSAEHSFAGQLESVLFVPFDQVVQRVVQVWLSGFSERIFEYYKENNLPLPPGPPSVLIQSMIDAECAGVAFGADPVSGQRGTRVVGAVYGLGSGLVSGDVDADTYHIDRSGVISKRELAIKSQKHVMDISAIEGVKCEPVESSLSHKPALSDSKIKRIAKLVATTSNYFGCPQDIEWAYKGNNLYLLQSRPITTLKNMADPDGNLTIWDNSNIAESYRGITTPLTFSFANRCYESVYREFCKMMRVPKISIEQNDDTFSSMLGLIKGQVYYNLINWYRVLAMLPGFKVNRKFMEQMMGVKKAMPDEIIEQIVPASNAWQKLKDSFRLGSSVIGLIINHFKLPRMTTKFYERLESALENTKTPLKDMRPDELASHYRDLERHLLKRWDAPLVNDFFAMIFYGVLSKLTANWCNDINGSLQNDLLIGAGDIISAEPAKRIKKMALLAQGHSQLITSLTGDSVRIIEQQIKLHPPLAKEYNDYINKFADRCLDELKLESPTLHDDPLPILRSIGHMAKRLETTKKGTEQHNADEARLLAIEEVDQLLSKHKFKRLIFNWVLKQTRLRVSSRENLRFERTRIFGRTRVIVVELGKRFHAVGVLDHPRDIFYLSIEEILGFIEGTSVSTKLAQISAIRKTEYKAYKESASPGDRFETRGIVNHNQTYKSDDVSSEIDGETIRGTGCCPGVIKGQVRVVKDPRNVELKQGEILVAERTDPGWIMLFPAAAGLLVEHGSLLSHSAIVAREMGIPAAVGLTGVTSWLQSGDWVEMDGRSGLVKRISVEGIVDD